MFTRKQYITKECSADEYWNQFSEPLVNYIKTFRPRLIAGIKKSKDKHFNDIPLYNWDSMANAFPDSVARKIAEANESGGLSLSDKVVSLKYAAEIIRSENE